jgi:hypothetical protein
MNILRFHVKIKVGLLAVSSLILAGAVASVPAFASSIGPADNYTYVIDLPTINSSGELSSSTGANIVFSWGLGPICANSTGVMLSYAVNGSPLEGYSNNGSAWTAATDENGIGYSEIYVSYSDGSGNEIVFTFIESDSFWATLGSQDFSTGSGIAVNGLTYDNFGTGGLTWGDTTTGANYTTYTDGVATDPSCGSLCTITTTEEPAPAATPEPSSLLLLGSGLMGLVGVVRRKIGLRA